MGLPGWPGGDPGALRDAASAWGALHDALLCAVNDATPAMNALFADWQGDAAKKFESTWQEFVIVHTNGAQGAAAVQKVLDTAADKLEEAHHKYEHMIEAMAATAAVGFGLSLLTAGLSDLAAGAAGAAIAGEIVELLTTLGVDLVEAIEIATEVGEAVGAATEAVVGFASNFVIGFAMSAGDQALDEALNGEKIDVSWSEAAIQGLTAATLAGLTDGKGLPTRIAVGAGVGGVGNLLEQAEEALKKSGFKDFNVDALVESILGGAAVGAVGKGPEAPEDPELDSLLEELGDDPQLADLLASDPDWLGVIASDPDLVKAIVAESSSSVTVITPTEVRTLVTTVRQVVVETGAPKQLTECIAKALTPQFVMAKGTELSNEALKKMISFEMEQAGGPAAVASMSPAQLQALANRIVAELRQPVPTH